MMIYIENAKETIRKLLEPISTFIRIMRYKVNTQKSLALIYTNNKKIRKRK